MRSKRPPALSFLLRMDTMRRGLRVLSLLVLDLFGVSLAIFTALALKEALLSSVDAHSVYEGTRSILAFAYLLTALLFARSGLYAERSQRPGLSRIVGSLFQVAFVALIFAVVSGEHFSSYYIFYGSLGFALFYISSLRYLYERATGAILHAAGYQRRAVLVGTGKHIHDVAHALADAPHSPIEVVGFVSPEPLPANGVRCLGTLDHLQAVIVSERVDEVIIADPDFPQERAVELVDQCHRRGVRVRIAPSTMEILIHRAEFVPGQSVPLFELGPPVFEGIDFALKRTFDLVRRDASACPAQSPACRDHARRAGLLAWADLLSLEATGHRPASVRCLKFRTMYCDAHEQQDELEELNEASGALFKIRDDPRLTPVGRLSAALLSRRAAPAGQRAARRDVARRPAPAARARLRAARGLASQALPRAARHHGPVAGVRPLRARLRRPRAPRLHLPRALVPGARPGDPAEDDPGGDHAARGLLNKFVRRLGVCAEDYSNSNPA